MINSLNEAVVLWKPKDSESHSVLHNTFCGEVNNVPELKEFRDFVEKHVYGFGERSFIWLWKLLVDLQNKEFTFVEIGVYKGQVLALMQLLANMSSKIVDRIGVSPLSSMGGYGEFDYEKDILDLHNQFNLESSFYLIKNDSTNPSTIKDVFDATFHGIDILYIDGGHSYPEALSDMLNYTPLVKKGGYVVVDDACCDMNIPYGLFSGHEPVTKACNTFFDKNNEYELIFSIVHMKIFKKL